MSFPCKSTPARNSGVQQLDLFLFPSSAPTIVGAVISLERACPRCGCFEAVVGSSRGPHFGSLTCANCNRHAGWLPGSRYCLLNSGAPNFATGLSSYPQGTAP
jgi:hypothetical protein